MQEEKFGWLSQYIADRDCVFFEEPMKNHTTFRIGGPAECLVMPSSPEELTGLVGNAKTL